MGTVRARINLTNAIDDELVNRGLLAPRLLRVIEAEGLVNTGAVSLVIPVKMASELGLRIIGQRKVKSANGSEEVIGFTGPVIVECLGRKTVDEALVVGNDVLIGQVPHG
jgi:predicted aspartyl protease